MTYYLAVHQREGDTIDGLHARRYIRRERRLMTL